MTDSRLMVAALLLLVGNPSFAGKRIEGRYETITESSCNYTLLLKARGSGTFIESCRREDGSHIDDVEKRKITWTSDGNTLTVFGLGLPYEVFSIHQFLSCEITGDQGGSFGVRGYGSKEFWKAPRKCK